VVSSTHPRLPQPRCYPTAGLFVWNRFHSSGLSMSREPFSVLPPPSPLRPASAGIFFADGTIGSPTLAPSLSSPRLSLASSFVSQDKNSISPPTLLERFKMSEQQFGTNSSFSDLSRPDNWRSCFYERFLYNICLALNGHGRLLGSGRHSMACHVRRGILVAHRFTGG
jgi:hypothetical protein